MDFWDRWFSLPIVVIGILVAILTAVCGACWVCAEWNKHNAPIAFAQCERVCGASGVHRADPDFKCECNATMRFDGKPSLDLNITNRP